MKKFVLTVVALCLAAAPASAQIESIGIYEDQTALDCEIADTAPGLKNIYIVHTNSAGTQASQWKLNNDPGMTMAFLSGTVFAPFLLIGSATAGASVAYTDCRTGTFPIMTVSYFASGTSTACSKFFLTPDTTADPPVLGIVDCGFNLLAFPPGVGVVNANGSCPCDVSTAQSTWGNVKALYK